MTEVSLSKSTGLCPTGTLELLEFLSIIFVLSVSSTGADNVSSFYVLRFICN